MLLNYEFKDILYFKLGHGTIIFNLNLFLKDISNLLPKKN